MDFKRRGLLLVVKELRLTHPYFLKEAQTFALRGLLILPRANVDKRETLRLLGSSESGELIGNNTQFHHGALFKQSVEGPFSFGLQLSKPVSSSNFSFLMGKLTETAVESAGALFAAQAIPPLRAGIRESARFFAGKLTKKDPMLLSEEYATVNRHSTHTITMTLSSSTSIREPGRRQGPKGRKVSSKAAVNAGEPIAKAKIQLNFFK